MNRQQNPNLEILEIALEQLGELADQMVFLGGCATGLLITDSAASPIRVTRDVDAIIDVVTHADYYKLSDQLRNHGFHESQEDDAPICRWESDHVILDVMPTEPEILGFGNEWYPLALEKAESIQLPSGKTVRMVSGPYFLITKLEAFDGRGNGDYQMSHDIEDIIAVMDGRQTLLDEVIASDQLLREALAERFDLLNQDTRFIESVPGHMQTDQVSQARVPRIMNMIKKIAERD